MVAQVVEVSSLNLNGEVQGLTPGIPNQRIYRQSPVKSPDIKTL